MIIDGAIFDMDGTLLDSMSEWGEIGMRYLRGMGVEPSEDIKSIFWSMSLAESAAYCKEHFGAPGTVDQIVDGMLEHINDFYINKAVLKDGVAELLQAFYDSGVKMCVATASDRSLATAALERNGVSKYFSEILTCAEVGAGKDYPDIFEQAREHMGTEKDRTFVFEDALYAVETAKKAGFKVVGVYDRAGECDWQVVKELSDYYYSCIVEAEELL